MRVFALKAFRKEMGLTQEEVANILKIPQSNVSQMELGKFRIAERHVQTLKNQERFKEVDFESFYVDVPAGTRFINNTGDAIGLDNYKGTDPAIITEQLELFRQLINEERERNDSNLKDAQSDFKAERRRADKLEKECSRLRELLLINGIHPDTGKSIK